MFIDRVVVKVKAGDGGSGVVAFRREKFVPMGGPDGGDGGRGGDIIIVGDDNLSTLLDYTYRDSWAAPEGDNGSGSNRSGRSGGDVVLPVPVGTVIKDLNTSELLGEILESGQRLLVAQGGRGGKGNAYFATPTHQSPREFQPGEDGQGRTLELELKLIADVGLVGQPNAGKSTLLSVISAARPKIGDYPFTTLSPNLGVVQLSDNRTFVVADLPGIIEGAHEGRGLGLQFLRHIERTRVLAFLVPIDAIDWQSEYDQLRREIESYSVELAQKPHCVLFTKMDLLGDDDPPPIDAPEAFGVFAISAANRTGLEPVLASWWSRLLHMKRNVSDKTSRLRFPDDARAILALTLVADVGSVTHRQLIERFRSASRALDGAFSPDVVANAYTEADEFLRQGERRGLLLTTQLEDGYPASLRELHAPPAVLWSRGDWATLRPPVVAVVGTRRSTNYGQRVTREIAGALARAGACIVSGMALGIDAYAHRAALDVGGATIAVLGTGADVPYPRAHTALHREIAEHGLLVSELPPGAKSGAGSFPRRNRIIAGLAALTIVVEAPEHSGALNTAKHALDLGRDVAAVPGPIDSPQSQGANELIRDGAHPITSVADALRLVGLEAPVKIAPVLNGVEEERVWSALVRGPASLDALCARTALPVSQCLTAVTALELRGVVECALTGEIRRR